MNKCKSYFLVLFFLGIWTNSYSQEGTAKIVMGESYKWVDSRWCKYFKKGDEILGVKSVDNKLIIQKWNVDGLEEIQRNEVNDFPSKSTIRAIKEFSGRYLVFYSKFNKRAKVEQLFVREVDFASATVNNEGSLLTEISAKGRNKKSGLVVSRYYFYASYDQSKLLIHYLLDEKNEEGEKVFGFEVYNHDLKSLWAKEAQLVDVKKNHSNWEATVSASGDVYLAAQVYTGDDRKKEQKSKQNYYYKLWRFRPNSTSVTEVDLALKDNKYVCRMDLQESPSGEIIFTGYTSSEKNLNGVSGMFLFKLDKNGVILHESVQDIPLAFINEYAGQTQVERNKKEEEAGGADLGNMVLREVICNKDGSILTIGEIYYFIIREHGRGDKRVTEYYYYYNDIMVTKIGADGNLLWMRKIPKRQSRVGSSGGMSYKYFYSGQKHYFLYLDHIDNLELDASRSPVRYHDEKGGYLMVSSIDDERGIVDKKSILEMKDIRKIKLSRFRPLWVITSDEKDFVFDVYQKRNKNIMIRVKLK